MKRGTMARSKGKNNVVKRKQGVEKVYAEYIELVRARQN